MLNVQERVEALAALWDDEKKAVKEKMEVITASLKDDEKEHLSRMIDNVKERLALLEQMKFRKENRKSERYLEVTQELESIREKVAAAKVKMELGRLKVKKRIGRLLKRNPDAVSFQFKEALLEIKNMKK